MSPSPGGGLTAVLRILWRTQWRYWLTWILVLAVSMTATAATASRRHRPSALVRTIDAIITPTHAFTSAA